MSINLTAIQPGVALGSTVAPIATATATSGTVLTSAVFTNTNSGVVTFSVYIVRSGDSAGAGNALINSQVLAQNQAYVAPELSGRNMAQGDALWAVASVNNVVNAVVDGFTIVNDEAGSSANVVA